jgi:hypothetical protein
MCYEKDLVPFGSDDREFSIGEIASNVARLFRSVGYHTDAPRCDASVLINYSQSRNASWLLAVAG